MASVVKRPARSPTALGVAILLLAGPAVAEEQSARVGDTAWALPGMVRVGVPAPGPRRVGLAGSAGYGYLEPQSRADGVHHRLLGSAAVSATPVSALALALRFDGRYDLHPDDGSGAHAGAVGDPRLLVRYGASLGESFRLGAELGAWFPGKGAPSVAFDATTLDAKLLAAFAPRSGPTLGVMAGFRLDQSAHAADDPNRLRFGDRLALGLSDFDAALVGVGISVPVSRTEVLGEVSGDLLVGSGAPSISRSPLRATAGVRHHVSDAIALELLAEASLSGRPSVGPNEPLVPIEPRATIIAGLRYALPLDAPPKAAATPEGQAEPGKPAATAGVAVTAVDLVVHVTGEDGVAIPKATVEIRTAAAPRVAEPGANGDYRFGALPLGDVTVSVNADGFVAAEQPVHVAADTRAPVQVKLRATPPSGQLRGLIRSFAGKGLAASILVEPIGTQANADAQGTFTLDVPPGDYEVVIRADHFKEQRRKVHVAENGVTILNADLLEAK